MLAGIANIIVYIHFINIFVTKIDCNIAKIDRGLDQSPAAIVRKKEQLTITKLGRNSGIPNPSLALVANKKGGPTAEFMDIFCI